MLRIVTRAEKVKARLTSIAKLNLELAQLELKRKATALGIALALGIVAGVLVLYAIGFLFAAAAAGLSEVVSLWLALLIVAGVILLVGAICGFMAVRFVKKVGPALPTEAIDEAQQTVKTMGSHV